MKVLAISPNNFVAGGSDKYFIEVSNLLEQKGHEVTKFCARNAKNEYEVEDKYFPRGIDTKSAWDAPRMIYNFDSARMLRKLVTTQQFDVAHLHIYYGHFTGSILRVLSQQGIPMVQTVHDYKPVCPVYSFNRNGQICEACNGREFWKATIHRCNKGSVARSALSTIEAYVTDYMGARTAFDRYIAVCHFQAKRLIANGLPEERVEVLHNFVETIDIARSTESRHRDTILYFGRIEKSKGVFDLVSAFTMLGDNERQGTKLVFAGNGEAASELRQMVAQNARGKNVEVLGFVDQEQIKEIAKSAICSVLVPRVYENCSMSVLESLAMGVPVIGGDIGGIPELVEHNTDGLIVPPNDISGLRNAIQQVIQEPDRAVSMGLAGQNKIRAKFGPGHHVARLEEILFSAQNS